MTHIKALFREQPVTMGLLVVNLLVFLLMNLMFPFRATSGEAIFLFGGLYGDYIRLLPTELWRLLSSSFVHIGFQHLAMNAFSLYIVGRIAEQIWRPKIYVTIYLLAGVFGGVLSIWLEPSVLSAGASSSIFGLFAGVAILGYVGHHPAIKQVGRSFQSLIWLNLLFNLFMPDVNIWGHLGGAIGGALLALALPNQVPDYFLTKSQRLGVFWLYLGLVLGMLVLFFR